MTNDMRNRLGYVYVLTNKNNRVLYVGLSSNLARRIKFHNKAYLRGFTKNYRVNEPSGGFCIISRWVILSEAAVGGERRILIMRSFTEFILSEAEGFRMTGQKLPDPSVK